MRFGELEFKQKQHIYQIRGTQLVSVTAWVKTFFRPFKEKEVAKKLHYILKRQGVYKTMTAIIKEWRRKREDGILVHKQIQQFIQDELLEDDYMFLHPKTRQGIMAIDYLVGGDKVYPHSEVAIAESDIGLAGTVDLMILKNGMFVLVDWKTNEKIRTEGYQKSNHELMKDEEDCNFNHYVLQLSTYAYILESSGWKCEALYICHLSDKDFKLIPVDYRRDKIEEMIKWSKDKMKIIPIPLKKKPSSK